MNPEITENPTRKKIVAALKKNGQMTVESLSKVIKITPMGVRQHLLILERRGIVEYTTQKHGVGRPGFLFKLTNYAENLFPKNYQDLAIDILDYIKEKDGRERIMDIFKQRKEKLLKENIGQFSEKTELKDKIKILTELLDKEGNMVELEEDNQYFYLKQYNCPIQEVSKRYKEACINDYELIKDLIRVRIIHKERISDGARACLYLIPKD